VTVAHDDPLVFMAGGPKQGRSHRQRSGGQQPLTVSIEVTKRCNARCDFCDYWKISDRDEMTDFTDVVRRFDPLVVVFTGGEPMLQERELVPLMQRLLEHGYTVLLETSGERPLERVPAGVVKIVDVKCPDSGEGDTFRRETLEVLNDRDEVKFVLSSRVDYEFAREFVARYRLGEKVNAVLFSPAFRKEASGARNSSHCLLDPQELAEWMIADNVPARLGLQLHKFIWDPATKGV